MTTFGRRGEQQDVRYWPKADIGLRGDDVCFGGRADIGVVLTGAVSRSCCFRTRSGVGA